MRFSFAEGLRCVTCGTTYGFDELMYTCPGCGPIAGTLDVLYDKGGLAASFGPEILQRRTDPTIWRYHEILPIHDAAAVVPIPVGMTPLYRLECDIGASPGMRLFVKDDTRHPSGSAKDRATAVGLARAREVGAAAVAAASTGNAASSLATFAARAALPCYVFAPASAPAAKLIQIRAHGAILFAVDGTYDQAFDLCTEACRRMGIYNRSTAINPLLGEGKKTISLEIWEQLGFRAPETILVPVGDGCIVGGVYKGFRDLLDLGLIERVPKIVGVQAAGSAAIATAWQRQSDRCTPVDVRTVADSISVSMPRDQVKALRAIRASGGCFITVSDEAILDAMAALASRAGIFVEPAAAAPLAGLREACLTGGFGQDEEVVLLHTGHGLKDIDSARRAASWNEPLTVSPEWDEVARVLAERLPKGSK